MEVAMKVSLSKFCEALMLIIKFFLFITTMLVLGSALSGAANNGRPLLCTILIFAGGFVFRKLSDGDKIP